MTTTSHADSSQLPLMMSTMTHALTPTEAKAEHQASLIAAARLSLSFDRNNPAWDYTLTRYRNATRAVITA